MIDFKKDLTYKAKTTPEITTIPEMLFVMVDGHGAPDGPDKAAHERFQHAMEALFGIVFTLKFWDKKHPAPAGYDKFSLAPVEGLWWTKSGKMFDLKDPDDWKWTLMLRVPDFVTPELFGAVADELVQKKQSDVFKAARLERYAEGEVVQIMHIGPYSQETGNIEAMHQFAKDNGYELHGKHHELYFGDPRRSAPEKLHTILRQPIRKV